MTAPQFATFTPPAMEDGDEFKPKDNLHKPLLVKVVEHKLGIVTSNTPEGGPGVIVELVDLTGRPDQPYRDVLWMGGAVVDGLKTLAGQVTVIRFDERKSKSGRMYPYPTEATAEDVALAQRYYTVKGDPFAPQFASLPDTAPAAAAPAADEVPPF